MLTIYLIGMLVATGMMHVFFLVCHRMRGDKPLYKEIDTWTDGVKGMVSLFLALGSWLIVAYLAITFLRRPRLTAEDN